MLAKVIAGYFLIGLIQAGMTYWDYNRAKNKLQRKELEASFKKTGYNIEMTLVFILFAWPFIDLLWLVARMLGKKILSGKK